MDAARRALGKRVRELRTDQGLSQEQLAERSHMHWTHISGIERARYDVKLSTLSRVARGLGVTISELLAGIETRRVRGSR